MSQGSDLEAAVKAAADLDPLIGQTLAGRYLLLRRVGEGGMGAVYEARHVVLGKKVAVKVLLEKFLSNSELVARLLQEARLASRIGHANIVDVADYGTTDDGRGFIVMEFLEGVPLSAVLLDEAPLPIPRTLRIVRQVTDALAAAHAKGIVHRDLKPENVFLLPQGARETVKVVDFGVSRAFHVQDEAVNETRLTQTGTVYGTPTYMSPEQASGRDDVDARSDIWAVGVMLYECLTGEVPYTGANYLGVISQILTQSVVPPSTLRPELGISPSLEAVVMRTLARLPSDRYQGMETLTVDLDALIAGRALPSATSEMGVAEVDTGSGAHGVKRNRTAAAQVQASGAGALVTVQPPRDFAGDFLLVPWGC